jgi:trehalose utilization protein
MATVLEEYITEEQSSLVRILWAKGLNARILVKKCFMFTVGSVCRVKWITAGSRNSLNDVRRSQMMPDQVRKWLMQQSKDVYAAGFDALAKRWDKCINVGGGCVGK